MDDHTAAATDFDSMFTFLHRKYFPRVVFGPVYLAGHKTHIFSTDLDLLGFHGSAGSLRPSMKHRDKIKDWPIPTARAELDAFLWLTPFLRIFIPGRAAHIIEMKKAYLQQVPAEPKAKQPHYDEMEEYDADLTKAPPITTKTKKPTIQRKWVEKTTFDWGLSQQESFDKVKDAISNNTMAGADPDLQYHLAVDASETAVGGCLFQLQNVPSGTEATPKVQNNEKIVMFLSFKLQDAETRYVNSERECLAIVKCLAEVRWLVMGSKYPVLVYSDHIALKSVFSTGHTEKSRISNWLDRLGEYDMLLIHRSSRDQHIGIADGLSRMPTRLSSVSSAEDTDRMAMMAIPADPEKEEIDHLIAMMAIPASSANEEMDHSVGANDISETKQFTFPRKIVSPYGNGLEKFRRSAIYHQIVEYLEGGEDVLNQNSLSRNRKRYLRQAAKSFRLPYHSESRVLRYTEKNGTTSVCITEVEVPRFLHAAYEDHGHYAASLTLDFLIGRAYWPSRVKDVYSWCRSCHPCQLRSKKPIKAEIQAI